MPEQARSDRIIAFIENFCRHTAGPYAGELFALRDWQKDIIRGIYDPQTDDGRRRIRTALISMARKNGKTELTAALALAHLVGPEAETRGEIYSAAADREQASMIYKAAAAMVRMDPDLEERINPIESKKRLVCYRNGSFYQALSSDSRTKHGFNASVILYDELAQAPNRNLYDVLTTSMGARAEPLVMVISTMSSDANSIMSELVDYGQQVNEGGIDDPTFAAWLFYVPDDYDPWAEENWYRANPGLGDFRSLEEMREQAHKAQRIPAREATFRNLYLNQRVDGNERFITSVAWKACGSAVDADDLRGRSCWGGLDLSSTQDLTSLVLVFPSADFTDIAVLPYFWLPSEGLRDKEDADRVPYTTWNRQGYLETTPGRAVDKRHVAQRIGQLAGEFDIQTVAYDRWRIEDLRRVMADEGVDVNLEGFGQGFKDMAPALDQLETAVVNQQLRHGNHPVMTWNAANAVVEMDPAGNRKLSKAKATGRIDGLVAMVMALSMAMSRGAAPQRSIYESRGLVTL